MNYELAFKVLEIGSYVIAGSVVAINLIAPLTKSTLDDKLGKSLSWVSEKLQAFVLPFLRTKLPPKK